MKWASKCMVKCLIDGIVMDALLVFMSKLILVFLTWIISALHIITMLPWFVLLDVSEGREKTVWKDHANQVNASANRRIGSRCRGCVVENAGENRNDYIFNIQATGWGRRNNFADGAANIFCIVGDKTENNVLSFFDVWCIFKHITFNTGSSFYWANRVVKRNKSYMPAS